MPLVRRGETKSFCCSDLVTCHLCKRRRSGCESLSLATTRAYPPGLVQSKTYFSACRQHRQDVSSKEASAVSTCIERENLQGHPRKRGRFAQRTRTLQAAAHDACTARASRRGCNTTNAKSAGSSKEAQSARFVLARAGAVTCCSKPFSVSPFVHSERKICTGCCAPP